MRTLWIILPLLIFSFGCHKESQGKKQDFNSLMGANTSVWKFIETHEDYENLNFFKEIFEANKDRQFQRQELLYIPKVVHFIWLGPNPFPKESIANINSWVENHPHWTFRFWTDRLRPLPNPKMDLHLVSDFEFESLRTCYENSDNYAEKSDVLRYEILHQEGGVYVDHDVKCFKPFSPFHYNFNLYCGLEPPHPPITSSSVSICNNIIGASPGHPVLKRVIELVEERWAKIGAIYPGDDKNSIIYRVFHRTFSPFNEAVKEKIGKEGNHDIVMPAAYFNRIDDRFALFAHHYYATTWFEDETKFERNVRRRLISISRKNNQILLFNAVILTANLFLLGCLAFQYRNIRRVMKKR